MYTVLFLNIYVYVYTKTYGSSSLWSQPQTIADKIRTRREPTPFPFVDPLRESLFGRLKDTGLLDTTQKDRD